MHTITKPMRDIIITLPSSIEWTDYEKELAAVADGKQVMNFKVPFLPKDKNIDRCYLVHRGKVIGWMKVVGFADNTKFDCTTTGREWSGKFIQRSGPFHYLSNPRDFRGFQGWRYYDADYRD